MDVPVLNQIAPPDVTLWFRTTKMDCGGVTERARERAHSPSRRVVQNKKVTSGGDRNFIVVIGRAQLCEYGRVHNSVLGTS